MFPSPVVIPFQKRESLGIEPFGSSMLLRMHLLCIQVPDHQTSNLYMITGNRQSGNPSLREKVISMLSKKLKIATGQFNVSSTSGRSLSSMKVCRSVHILRLANFPCAFLQKRIPIQLAVEKFVSLCRSLHVVEDCLLDSLEENLLKQGTQEELDNEDRLCVATVICQDEQSLKVGRFVKGSYGWVVSTSDRLQCYAYTPCTLLFMVPAGCRVNEACAPTSHLHLKQIFPLSKYQEQDCTMKNNDPDKVELSQATPLGFNPTKSPADSPGTPVGETSNKSDDTKDDSTKIVSPTQVWSEGMPVTRDKAKTTPSYRRACDKVNVPTMQRNGTKIIGDQVDKSQSKPIPHSSPLLQQSERVGIKKPLPSQDRNNSEYPIASPSIAPALDKVINADQPADGFVADIEEDGSNVRPSIDSIVGLAEGDRCMLEKNVLLHGEGVPCISGSIEKTSIPSHQSILPPKSQEEMSHSASNFSHSCSKCLPDNWQSTQQCKPTQAAGLSASAGSL